MDRVIVSSHNPDLQINDELKKIDPRVIILHQAVKRGCGYRWLIASDFDPEYLIVVDDDLLLYPWQVAQLFGELVRDPDVPHGFSGLIHHDGDRLEYRERENLTVDYLCEVYAVTRRHLTRYHELRSSIENTATLADIIEAAVDFVLISRTGDRQPRIHRTGRLLRCSTFKLSGVAIHQEAHFSEYVVQVSRTLGHAATHLGTGR